MMYSICQQWDGYKHSKIPLVTYPISFQHHIVITTKSFLGKPASRSSRADMDSSCSLFSAGFVWIKTSQDILVDFGIWLLHACAVGWDAIAVDSLRSSDDISHVTAISSQRVEKQRRLQRWRQLRVKEWYWIKYFTVVAVLNCLNEAAVLEDYSLDAVASSPWHDHS